MNLIKKLLTEKKHEVYLSKILFITSQLFLNNTKQAFNHGYKILGTHILLVYFTSCLLWWNYNNSGVFRNVDNFNVFLLLMHVFIRFSKYTNLIKGNIGMFLIAVINIINYKLIEEYHIKDDITFIIIHGIFHIRSYLFLKEIIKKM
jgi:hypothetical protein